MTSPLLTVSSFDTRSSRSMPRPPWRIAPLTPVARSRADTWLSGSVISVTTAVDGLTFVTRPTRPSALTTGVFSRIPELEPAAIAICSANGPLGNEITVVFTARKSFGYIGPCS
jgi:hypothetical protein